MMLNRRVNRYLQRILLGIVFLLIAITTIGLFRNYNLEPGTSETALQQQDIQNTAEVPPLPLAAYAEIVERPLFSDTRRPFVPEVIPEQAAPVRAPKKQEDALFLSGIVITGGKRLALIESQQNNKTESLNEGDQLNDWIVSDIQSDKVRLTRGTEEQILELMVKPSTSRQRGRTAPASNNTVPAIELVTVNPPEQADDSMEEEDDALDPVLSD